MSPQMSFEAGWNFWGMGARVREQEALVGDEIGSTLRLN